MKRAEQLRFHFQLARRCLSSSSNKKGLKTVSILPTKFNLQQRIKEIEKYLKPPVNNRLIAEDFIKVMIVGGPNERVDYHITTGQELFYQLKGGMAIEIIHPKTKQPYRVKINEGEMFLLPAGVPHSPQRFENTVGLVLERERNLDEVDCLRWFHQDQPAISSKPDAKPQRISYEEYFHCSDLNTQLPPVIRRYREYVTQHPSLPSTSYYSNQDQIQEKKESIRELNDLFYSKEIENFPIQVVNIKERIQQEIDNLKANSDKAGVIPHRYSSFFPIYQSEFEFRVYTGLHQQLSLPQTTSSVSPTTRAHDPNHDKDSELPIVLPFLNTAKEFVLYQYSGNAKIRKQFAPKSVKTPPQSATHNKHGETNDDEKSCIELKEGDMVIIQDLENNLQGLTVDFENKDEKGILWFWTNNASVDCR